MQTNIILAGVGGQGILSVAYVIDHACLAAGYHFKQAEVHGMAQRGGAVQSNLRFSDRPIHSDLIPRGKVDVVLSVEPLEVMRYWHFLAPEGWVVTSTTPYVNIPDYPEVDDLLTELVTFPNLTLVDTGRIAKAAGNLRAQNMVMVGAASIRLGFAADQMLPFVEQLFAAKGDKIVEINRRAFLFGRAAGEFFRGLVDGGMAPLAAHRLMSKLDPASLDPARTTEWIQAIGDDDRRLDEILALEGDLASDQAPALS
jgi:indolepyruvate ferredoxin oxidoreductase beta subunit